MHDSSAPEGCRSGDHRIFHPYLPYVKVCGALLKSMSTISFTRCSNASGHGLFMTWSRIEDPPPHPKASRARGSAAILIRVQSA